MPSIYRTRESRLDYEEIWHFIALKNADAAEHLLHQFDAKLETLASHPLLGRSAEELAPKLRIFPVGNYLIFYRPVSDGIQLIRVLHGAREITPEYFSGE